MNYDSRGIQQEGGLVEEPRKEEGGTVKPRQGEEGIGLKKKEIPKMTPNDLIRFMAKVSKSTGCWNWVAGKFNGGYGKFRIGNKFYLSHRVSYSIHFGETPAHLCLLHKCDNPSCVNPDHLQPGTHLENSKDMISKGRAPTGKRNGHHTKPEMTPRGELHERSKLTENQVLSIRKRFNHTYGQLSEMAREFFVTAQSIYAIVKRKSWKHI